KVRCNLLLDISRMRSLGSIFHGVRSRPTSAGDSVAVARPPLLLDTLRDSDLLAPDQIKELSLLPEARDADPRALRLPVLHPRWLTRYQISLIAEGRGKELNLGPYLLLDRLGE